MVDTTLFYRPAMAQAGLSPTHQVGVTLIGRAKGRHFLVFNGSENIELDAVPPTRPDGSK